MDYLIKTKTIIYGGAFNPPTIAHQVILQECVNYAAKIGAEVWVLPSGTRTDKTIEVSEDQRVNYLQALITDLDRSAVPIRVDLTELRRNIMVETYDTAAEFEKTYPDREFIWVFGADSTQTMEEWKEGLWLRENMRMLLLKRPGSEIHPGIKHYESLNIPPMNVSSTELRRRIAAEENYSELVSPTVHKILVEQNS